MNPILNQELLFRIVPFGQTDPYQDLLKLRTKVLRDGLLPYKEQELQSEKDDLHIGLYRLGKTEAIGCLLIRRVGEWCQMRQVAIDPSEQGKGLGSLLITYFEDYARSIGITHLFIEARESAVPFYLHNGYSVLPESFVNEGSGLVNYRLEKVIKTS
jgi:N-acetylglutamate synthase-like GNAT family acetyltransferase